MPTTSTLRSMAIYTRLHLWFPTFAIAIVAFECGGAPKGQPSTTGYIVHWVLGPTPGRAGVHGTSRLATVDGLARTLREAWSELRRWRRSDLVNPRRCVAVTGLPPATPSVFLVWLHESGQDSGEVLGVYATRAPAAAHVAHESGRPARGRTLRGIGELFAAEIWIEEVALQTWFDVAAANRAFVVDRGAEA